MLADVTLCPHCAYDVGHTPHVATIPQGALMGHKTLPKQTNLMLTAPETSLNNAHVLGR